MNYTIFKLEIEREIINRAGEGMTVSVESVIKNNGQVLDGLIIRSEYDNTSPIIYLNEFYEEYKSTGDLDDCVNKIFFTINENSFCSIDMGWLRNWDTAKEKVRLMLINREMNKEMLINVPYENYLDLVIIYYLELETNERGQASIKVTNSLMESWDITFDQLHQKAFDNMLKYNAPQIVNMNEVVKNMMKDSFSDMDDCEVQNMLLGIQNEPSPIYVLSNDSKIKGACGILCSKALSNFAGNIGKDIYILPSSIHEVILVPDDGSFNPIELRKMVQEVNDTQVAIEEVLSDHVYLFQSISEEIQVVA